MEVPFEYIDIYLPIIALVVIYLGSQIECRLAKQRRYKLAILQRQRYYNKIKQEKEMEEIDLEKRIEALQLETDELASKLGQDDLNESSIKQYNNKDVIKKTIETLKQKRDQLQVIEQQICETLERVGLDTTDANDLGVRIKNLEEENKKLKSQSSQNRSTTLPPRQTELDQELLDYLKKNDEEMSMEFLSKAYETLLEIKASHPCGDLSDYVSKMNKSTADYDSELTKLEVNRKMAEKKLEQTRRHYSEEFNNFYEERIEYMFKNTGAQELLTRLKERNFIAEEMVRRRNKESRLVDGPKQPLSPHYGDYFPPAPDDVVAKDEAL